MPRERPKKISDQAFKEYFGAEPDTSGLEDKEAAEKPSKTFAKPREALAAEPPIDISKVIFTTHAIDQFTDRFKKACLGSELKNPQKTALGLLAAAKETDAIGRVHKIRRLIKHSFDEVRYFAGQGWRFVVKEADGKLLVVTIERS